MHLSVVLLGFFLFLVIWPLALYPGFLMVLHKLRSQQPPRTKEPAEWPDAVLLICALNERNIISKKLENSLQLEYPGQLRIVVISDGSTDGTAEAVRAFAARGVELIDQPKRRGKVTNLNEVIQARPEPIVVLSDANVLYDSKALLHLIRHFDDPQVGCVSGKVRLVNTTADLQEGEQSYYSLEWVIQEEESRLWSMAGADGAMYALRRSLYRPCPPDTLIEDLVIPTQIIRQGYRAILEPAATAVEEGPASLSEEFRRKVRIAAGAAQGLLRGNVLPGGKAPFVYWLIFVSHKLLRWLTPVTGALAIVMAVFAWPNLLAQLVLGGVVLVGILAWIRWALNWDHPALNAPFYFVFGQLAVAKGLWRGFSGRQSVLWAKANR